MSGLWAILTYSPDTFSCPARLCLTSLLLRGKILLLQRSRGNLSQTRLLEYYYRSSWRGVFPSLAMCVASTNIPPPDAGHDRQFVTRYVGWLLNQRM